MRIGNDSAFVEIERSYIDVKDPLARCYNARLENDSFAGTVGEIWISPTDAQSFLRQLNELEQNKGETAVLRNLSSDSDVSPLSFEIRKIDSLGHIGVFATVRELRWLREKTSVLSLSFSFELERGALLNLCVDFKKFFS